MGRVEQKYSTWDHVVEKSQKMIKKMKRKTLILIIFIYAEINLE